MPLVAIAEGARVLATPDGPRRGSCVDCAAEMIAKTGEIVTHHWAHRHTADVGCGAGETDWHLTWKSRCTDLDRIEVSRGQRRADLLTPYGWAVEFQHSPLSVAEVGSRERDWGRRMVWVFDARAAADESRLTSWRPDGRHHHTIEWAWSKAYVIAAAVPTFIQTGDDDLFLVGRWFDKKPDRPIRGYGWHLGIEAFTECVINGRRPPRQPRMSQPLDPYAWVNRTIVADCPTCGEPVAGRPLEQGPRRCSAPWVHKGMAA